MTRVCVRPPQGRDGGMDDFTDITDVPVAEAAWASGGILCIDFAGELTPDEVRRVAIRCQSLSPAEEEARLELDALIASLSVNDPALTDRERTLVAALALVGALLTPGPVSDT